MNATDSEELLSTAAVCDARFFAHAEEKNDWSDFTALCIFYVSVNVKYGMKLIGLNFLTCLDVHIFEKSSRLCRMDGKHFYRYCEHCEEFVSARTFLRHKEAYCDDHTRIWSKDSQSAPSTSEDDGDDGGAIQINSGQGYIMHVVSLVVLAISALSLISLYYFCI